MTSASDETWRPFNCFFSRVGLRTYQHPYISKSSTPVLGIMQSTIKWYQRCTSGIEATKSWKWPSASCSVLIRNRWSCKSTYAYAFTAGTGKPQHKPYGMSLLRSSTEQPTERICSARGKYCVLQPFIA